MRHAPLRSDPLDSARAQADLAWLRAHGVRVREFLRGSVRQVWCALARKRAMVEAQIEKERGHAA